MILSTHTFSCRGGEGGGGVPSSVEDSDSDVIAGISPQTSDGVAVLVPWESSTGPSLSIADSSSCPVC